MYFFVVSFLWTPLGITANRKTLLRSNFIQCLCQLHIPELSERKLETANMIIGTFPNALWKILAVIKHLKRTFLILSSLHSESFRVTKNVVLSVVSESLGQSKVIIMARKSYLC